MSDSGRLTWRQRLVTPVVSIVLFLPIVAQLLDRDAIQDFGGVHDWFDPLFLHLNLLLLTVAVLFIPFLAITYVAVMRNEKRRRMEMELGDALWQRHHKRIDEYIAVQFAGPNYIVSVAAMMVIVAFGGAILLLAKPLVAEKVGAGLDFTRGTNLLLIGPFIEDMPKSAHLILHSLTAIAFGFLGAYAYSITQLIRSYFTVDLTPNTFVAAATRLIVACVLTLVFSYAFSFILGRMGEKGEASLSLLPVFGFFFGYFPSKALLGIERFVSRWFGALIKEEGYGATPLNHVGGMNMTHAARLEREGIDNAENLAESDPLEIAVRTGFPYRQVKRWVEEAWLKVHLGNDDYDKLSNACGIATREQLLSAVDRWPERKAAFETLAAASGVPATKLVAVHLLSGDTGSLVPARSAEIPMPADMRLPVRDSGAGSRGPGAGATAPGSLLPVPAET